VVFPQYSERETNDDEKSLSYLALSKARLGYGLFDFKRLGMNLIMETNFGEEVIYTDNEDAFKNITLYDTKEKSQTEDKVNYDLIFNKKHFIEHILLMKKICLSSNLPLIL
jgi:hypothetical protein